MERAGARERRRDHEQPVSALLALDPTTGTVAVGFHDCRNDNGVPGPGGTNIIPNDDAEYYGTFSTDGGATWAPNRRLSGGFSNAAAAGNGIDFGDYVGLSAFAGKLYTLWADNANCDGTNANGTLHAFDLYADPLMLPAELRRRRQRHADSDSNADRFAHSNCDGHSDTMRGRLHDHSDRWQYRSWHHRHRQSRG